MKLVIVMVDTKLGHVGVAPVANVNAGNLEATAYFHSPAEYVDCALTGTVIDESIVIAPGWRPVAAAGVESYSSFVQRMLSHPDEVALTKLKAPAKA